MIIKPWKSRGGKNYEKQGTIQTLREQSGKRQKITMITGYDYPLALLEERAGIDIILVGDSLGMTVLDYDSTLPVEMGIMLEHAKSVRRGAPAAYVIGDMPYTTYQISIEEAIRNAGLYMKAGMDAVKLDRNRVEEQRSRSLFAAGSKRGRL